MHGQSVIFLRVLRVAQNESNENQLAQPDQKKSLTTHTRLNVYTHIHVFTARCSFTRSLASSLSWMCVGLREIWLCRRRSRSRSLLLHCICRSRNTAIRFRFNISLLLLLLYTLFIQLRLHSGCTSHIRRQKWNEHTEEYEPKRRKTSAIQWCCLFFVPCLFIQFV